MHDKNCTNINTRDTRGNLKLGAFHTYVYIQYLICQFSKRVSGIGKCECANTGVKFVSHLTRIMYHV